MRKRRFCGNRALYRRLLLDKDYVDVRFDVKSGGVSAVHKYHRFDQQRGPYGTKRGEYEKRAVDVLRRKGNIVLLDSERPMLGTKTPDGILNGTLMEIKAVESAGHWAIRRKLFQAAMQGAACVILYFPERGLYSSKRIQDGLEMFLNDPQNKSDLQGQISRIVVVVEERIAEIKKPPW